MAAAFISASGAGAGVGSGAPVAAGGGEDECRVAVLFPPVAQLSDHGGGDGHVAGFAAFALAHEESPAGGVDVAHLDGARLGQAQAAAVDEAEVGVEAGLVDGGEQRADLFAGDDFGDCLAAFDDDFAEHGPLRVDSEEVVVEAADGALGLVHRAGLVVAIDAQVDEVVAHLILGDRPEQCVRVVTGELADVGDVGGDGARSAVAELDMLAVLG